jgi:hypothetical protein
MGGEVSQLFREKDLISRRNDLAIAMSMPGTGLIEMSIQEWIDRIIRAGYIVKIIAWRLRLNRFFGFSCEEPLARKLKRQRDLSLGIN